MTAEDPSPEKPGRSFVPWIAAALVVMTLAAIGGWLYTVRELNRLTAYKVVGAEALRLARFAGAESAAPAIYTRKWE